MIKKAVFLFALCILSAYVSYAGPVSYYGKLKAHGKYLVGSRTGDDIAVQLRGVSLGWSNSSWESADFFNSATVNAMVDGWKAEIIRVPMGSDNKSGVKTAINAAIAQDVYVVIDWHTHDANSSNAATFFREMAQEFGSKDHVIFEIFNEPLAVSWSTIKNYANVVIDTIRKYSDNLILVGTPNWSQNVDVVVGDAISGNNRGNIAYVLHFYAGTHSLTSYTASGGGNASKQFRTAINTVLNADLPIFVTEYGTVTSDGGLNSDGNYNTHKPTTADAWHTFMDQNCISSCAWQVNDKYEGSAFFGTNSGTWKGGNRFNQTAQNFVNKNMMTESGKYIYDKLVGYGSSAPWRTDNGGCKYIGSSSSVSSSSGGSSPIFMHPQIAAVNSATVAKNSINLAAKNNAVVEVFGLRGNSMRRYNFANGIYTVSLSDLPKGLYIVKISFGSEKKILRVPIN